MPVKDIREIHARILSDPETASKYLNEALDTGEEEVAIMALRNIVEAQEGGFGGVAKRAHLGRESMYKTLSKKGNPKLRTLFSLLKGVGLQLHSEPQKQKHRA